MEGIGVVRIKVGNEFKKVIHGLNETKRKIISVMGAIIIRIYDICENSNSNLESSSISTNHALFPICNYSL
jgi:hypothetical protein